MNLARLVEDNINRYGEYCYIHYEGRWYTNVEMKLAANRLGNALKSLGIKKGDRVGAQLFNCPEIIQLFQAVLKIGAVIVPISPGTRAGEAAHIYADSGIKALITHSEYLPAVQVARQKAPELKTVVLMDKDSVPDTLSFDALVSGCSDQLDTEETDNDDVASLIYTSGTTGLPKGVIHSHFSIYYSILGLYEFMEDNAGVSLKCGLSKAGRTQMQDIEVFGLRKQRTTILVLPLCHVYGMGSMLYQYYMGDKLILLKKWNTSEVLRSIEKYRVTDMEGVPAMWRMLLNDSDTEKYDLSSLTNIGCGGAPLPLELIKEWKQKYGVQIYEGWGMSENFSMGTTMPMGRPYKYGSCGVNLLKGSALKIFDDNAQELPVGAWGEVVFKGPSVMKGYWNLPVETANTIKNGWLHTGDIGYLDEEGNLFLTDRKKDMIIRGGENVFPADVENVLYEHPKVMECGVIGIPDKIYGEEIKAFVSLKLGQSCTEQELLEFCKAKLPTFKQPKSIEFQESLPKSDIGKILKKELRKQVSSRTDDRH